MSKAKQIKTVNDLLNLEGQVALVTGGAGRVGRQLCLALCQAGATVIVASRDSGRRGDLSRELQDAGHRAFDVELDVTSEESAMDALAAVMDKAGRLDTLVNNAGIGTNIMVEDLSVEEFDRIMKVNVTGVFICSKVFSGPILRARRGGSIINISSIYGVVAADQRIYGDSKRNSSLPYAASKAAIIQMTRYLAVYWAGQGIRVNAISPGGVFNNQEQEFIDAYCSRVPLAKMVGSHDLMGAVVYLASEASAIMTGQNLILDGGWTIW